MAGITVWKSPFPTMSSLPTQFSGVTVHTKANVYFDGKVVSPIVIVASLAACHAVCHPRAPVPPSRLERKRRLGASENDCVPNRRIYT